MQGKQQLALVSADRLKQAGTSKQNENLPVNAVGKYKAIGGKMFIVVFNKMKIYTEDVHCTALRLGSLN